MPVVEITQTVDARGLSCPMPIVKIAQAVKPLPRNPWKSSRRSVTCKRSAPVFRASLQPKPIPRNCLIA